MNERVGFLAMVLLAALLVAGLAVFGIMQGFEEGLVWSGVVLAIVVLVALAMVWQLKREKDRIRDGYPKEDERTNRIRERAGYYAYMGGMYFALGLMWLNFILADFLGGRELEVTFVLASVLVMSFVLFLMGLWYFGRKELA